MIIDFKIMNVVQKKTNYPAVQYNYTSNIIENVLNMKINKHIIIHGFLTKYYYMT